MNKSIKTNSEFDKYAKNLCFEFNLFEVKENKFEEMIRKFNFYMNKFKNN